MNRTTRTVVKIILIAAVTVACVALVYYLGANIAGHKLATASDNMNYSRWLEKYFALTRALGWFLAARFFLEVDEAEGAGKRIFWAGLMLASLAINLGVAHFYAPILGIKLNGIIFGLFAAIFTGAGYWLLTIFTTPLAFKYTPLGAQMILSRAHRAD